jgi:hypothetical protein
MTLTLSNYRINTNDFRKKAAGLLMIDKSYQHRKINTWA